MYSRQLVREKFPSTLVSTCSSVAEPRGRLETNGGGQQQDERGGQRDSCDAHHRACRAAIGELRGNSC